MKQIRQNTHPKTSTSVTQPCSSSILKTTNFYQCTLYKFLLLDMGIFQNTIAACAFWQTSDRQYTLLKQKSMEQHWLNFKVSNFYQ